MKKTIIFIFGVMVTAAHAKLDKMMKEVFENQIKKADFYDAPKAIQGRYVPPIANQNYLQLIEKYLPDIKDTMYNSCAPALKRADQLPLSSLYSLTLFVVTPRSKMQYNKRFSLWMTQHSPTSASMPL